MLCCVCVCLSCSFAYEYACCRAKNALLEVGGTEDEFGRIKDEATSSVFEDTMSACMKKEFDEAGVGKDDFPTDEQVDTALANCKDVGTEALTNTGGETSEEGFRHSQMHAAEQRTKDIMKSCMDSVKNITSCKAKARKALNQLGFRGEEFNYVWDIAKDMLVGDAYEACVAGFLDAAETMLARRSPAELTDSEYEACDQR